MFNTCVDCRVRAWPAARLNLRINRLIYDQAVCVSEAAKQGKAKMLVLCKRKRDLVTNVLTNTQPWIQSSSNTKLCVLWVQSRRFIVCCNRKTCSLWWAHVLIIRLQLIILIIKWSVNYLFDWLEQRMVKDQRSQAILTLLQWKVTLILPKIMVLFNGIGKF